MMKVYLLHLFLSVTHRGAICVFHCIEYLVKNFHRAMTVPLEIKKPSHWMNFILALHLVVNNNPPIL